MQGMNTHWQQVWVEVDESAELSNYRMRVEQLTWELEDLRNTLAKKEELLLQKQQKILELKQERNQLRKRNSHGHGRRCRQLQADKKEPTRRRSCKSTSSSSYS